MNFTKKRSLLNACIALSFSTFITQAYGETVTVQAENFNNSGGTFNDGQPNPINIYTVNGQGAINWINNGDYVDYNINVIGGEYTIEYLVGTSIASNANIELFTNTNGSWVSQGTVAVPFGSWDDFQPLTHSSTITLPSGGSTVRIQATGANWQWNLESFSLTADDIDTGGETDGDTFIVEMEDFDATGGRVNGVVVGERGTPQDKHTVVDSVQNGDWIDYNINFPADGNYRIEMLASGQNNVANATIYVDGALINEVPVYTGSQATFETFELTASTFISTGVHTIRVEATTSGANGWMWFGDNLTITNLDGAGGDADNDGVNDSLDQCPNTPAGTNVDANGCAIVVGNPGNPIHLDAPITIPESRQIQESSVWFTYPQNSQIAGFDNFGATGAFWGHMPNQEIDNPTVLSNWVNLVQGYRNQGLDYVGRGEFDWGFRWYIDFVGDPTNHWARTLNDDIVLMTFMGNHTYKGYPNGWLSNHSPTFVDYYKSQVDALLSANVSHIMFDSQTSSTRSTDLNQFGGDFSNWAIDGFREYMRGKYTTAELSTKGISNINSFDYRQFLLNAGYTHTSYMAAANTISGGVPLFDDFIYFNRDVLNEKMGEVLDYIRSKDATIEVGATTYLTEARGYIFDDDITFLAGELDMGSGDANADEMSFPIISHLKAAEAVDRTLVYFTYPWNFADLHRRGSPQTARGWIAQSYAMGAVFSIPANIWVGDAGVWAPGADNYRDIYQFADARGNLLDNYDAYSKVGLVSPMMASLDTGWINGSNGLQGSIRYLIENNLNFDLLVFGDPGHPVVPTQAQLDSLDTIIVDGDRSYLTANQNALLNANDSKVLDLADNGDTAALNALKASNISVTVNGSASDDDVSALSRVHESNNNAPYVIHLLNRPVNVANGTTTALNNVQVAIPQGYFPEGITQATIHLPGGSSTNASLSINASGDTVITVNSLGVWGIIELSH